MFAAAIAGVKSKISATVSMALWGVIAGIAALVACGFFTAALFVWLSDKYDSLIACLVVGAIFIALALLAIVVALILRQRAQRASTQHMMQLFADIATIGTGFNRSMKGPQGKYYLLGAIAAGWLLSKTMSRR